MAGYGIVAIWADVVSAVTFNTVYSKTVATCKGCVFFLGAACFMLGLVTLR